MAATTTIGHGQGVSGKPTTNELSILSTAPSIIMTGIVETTSTEEASPPGELATVTFPYPLPGGAASYVILLTTINGGKAYVVATDEDDDGNFTSFSVISESDCSVMYLVSKVGIKPHI